MGIRDWKIGTKITVGFLAILVALTAASAYLIASLRGLATLQNEAIALTDNHDLVMAASVEAAGLPAAWGHAIINRDLAKSRRELSRFTVTSRDLLDRIDRVAETAEEKRVAGAIRSAYTRYVEAANDGLAAVERFLEAERRGEPTAELWAKVSAIDDQVDELGDETAKALATLAEMHEAEADRGDKLFDATIDRAIQVAVVLAIVGAILGIVIGVATARSITGPIARVVGLLQRIAGADLSETIAVDRRDEVGDILKSTAEMSQALRSLIGDAKSASAAVASATSQINASSRRSVESSQGQLAAVQETTTSATELQETARVAGERAREIQTALGSTADSGQSIRAQLGEATGLLGRAREELQTIVVSVQELSGRNQQIGEIIESVSDVADQTQLLAVNAAIEAAKAGEIGRGFGVVASEMKALAEQSKKSAQRIRGIVGEVQTATAETVRLVETGQERLQQALGPVTAILPEVEKLTVQVEESGQSGRQIVAIVNQQGAGIEQISQAMKAIQGGVQEGLAQTQQVERAAESLTTLAAKLRDTVAVYRL